MAEGAIDIIPQLGETQFGNIQPDNARFDLAQIKNVVDEREQIVARCMNGFAVFHLPGS